MTALETALVKLRRSTELALGYPDAQLSRAEADALLALIDTLKARSHLLETARDKWYATETRLRKKIAGQNADLRNLRQIRR